MRVNRRTALKQFALFTAGVALMPSCVQEEKKYAALPYKNIKVDEGDAKILAEFSEMIIPANDGPGAKDISAHLFVLKMADDCMSKENRLEFIKGMKDFEKKADVQYGKPFADCSQAQKEFIIKELETTSEKQPVNYFYDTAKSLVIRAYTTSQYYLTKVQPYELVPGRYHGCVPVNKKA